MTRAEFAVEVQRYFAPFAGNMNVMEYLRDDKQHPDRIYSMLADIATNGFDPEPTAILSTRQEMITAVEAMQEAAKRSRPFIGSHKLPYNSDWD